MAGGLRTAGTGANGFSPAPRWTPYPCAMAHVLWQVRPEHARVSPHCRAPVEGDRGIMPWAVGKAGAG